MVTLTMLEVQHRIKEFTSALHPSTEWSKRVKALQDIAAWAQDEKGSSSHAFVNGIHQLRDLIAEQIGDLRSCVVKEACQTIEVLADTMKEAAFQAHVDAFLTNLLKILVVTIDVIASAGDTCIRKILSSTRTGHYSALNKLLEAATSKSSVLRRCCIEYFGLIAATWNAKAMTRHRVPDTIAKLLLLGLCDANNAVRASSRKTFWIFHCHFQAKARLVYEKLDPSTKQLVLQDGDLVGADVLALSCKKSAQMNHHDGLESEASSISTTSSISGSVFTRLYQPHYFQDRATKYAKLKEQRELVGCTFTPTKRPKQVKAKSKVKSIINCLPPPPPYVDTRSGHLSPVACS